jgi:hypothetical protein
MNSVRWFEQVVATPAIGVRHSLELQALSPQHAATAEWIREQGMLKNLQLVFRTPIDMDIRLGRWLIQFRPDQTVVSYVVEPLLKKDERGLPSLGVDDYQPYPTLFEECASLANAALSIRASSSQGNFRLRRVGIVLATYLCLDEDLPPGIAKYKKYIGDPWSSTGGAVKATSEILMQLADAPTSNDRCFHGVQFDETGDSRDFFFKLDWQRTFLDNHVFEDGYVNNEIGECAVPAMKYFDDFGIGGTLLEV